jgi:hypothetical protein
MSIGGAETGTTIVGSGGLISGIEGESALETGSTSSAAATAAKAIAPAWARRVERRA